MSGDKEMYMKALDDNALFLQQNLEMNETMIAHIRERRILDPDDTDKLAAITLESDRVAFFLTRMRRRAVDAFDNLLSVLLELGRDDIYTKLQATDRDITILSQSESRNVDTTCNPFLRKSHLNATDQQKLKGKIVAKSDYIRLKKEIQDKNETLQRWEELHRKLNFKLVNLENEVVSYKDRTEKQKRELSENENLVRSLQEETKSVKKLVLNLTEKVQTLEDANDKLTKNGMELKHKLSKSEENARRLQNEKNILEERVEQSKAKVKELNSKLKIYTDENNKLNAQIKTLTENSQTGVGGIKGSEDLECIRSIEEALAPSDGGSEMISRRIEQILGQAKNITVPPTDGFSFKAIIAKMKNLLEQARQAESARSQLQRDNKEVERLLANEKKKSHDLEAKYQRLQMKLTNLVKELQERKDKQSSGNSSSFVSCEVSSHSGSSHKGQTTDTRLSARIKQDRTRMTEDKKSRIEEWCTTVNQLDCQSSARNRNPMQRSMSAREFPSYDGGNRTTQNYATFQTPQSQECTRQTTFTFPHLVNYRVRERGNHMNRPAVQWKIGSQANKNVGENKAKMSTGK